MTGGRAEMGPCEVEGGRVVPAQPYRPGKPREAVM